MDTAFAKAKAAMGERGLTLADVARESGVSVTYLHDLLSGKRGNRKLKDHAPRIAGALGLTVEDLYPGLMPGREPADGE